MSRLIPVLLIGCVAVIAVGCQDSKSAPGKPIGGEVDARVHAPLPAADRPADFDSGTVKPAEPPPAGKADVADAIAGTGKPIVSKPEPLPPSGVVTAGSFDDNLDPATFRSLCLKSAHLPGLGELARQLSGHRLLITVRDAAGRPINNARVRLVCADGSVAESVTRSDGRAVFVSSFDEFLPNQNLLATVVPPDGSETVTDTIAAGAARWDFTLPRASGALPANLDLAIVLDTTGSMHDEMRYLQSEIKAISRTIKDRFPDVRQRFSLVVYRDEGDEYVTRRFDFTSSVDEFHKNLSAQRSAGGGDYPEAVHRGLEDALQLRWRETGETACLMFLIGDAPPHAQHMGRALKAVDALRKRGVAIYPVACSGYDDSCEFVMRASAYLTGAQFLFLTDDSGVGNSHAEPRIPYYQVERLDKLMVRLISGELSGRPAPAEAKDVIRTVGRKIN